MFALRSALKQRHSYSYRYIYRDTYIARDTDTTTPRATDTSKDRRERTGAKASVVHVWRRRNNFRMAMVK